MAPGSSRGCALGWRGPRRCHDHRVGPERSQRPRCPGHGYVVHIGDARRPGRMDFARRPDCVAARLPARLRSGNTRGGNSEQAASECEGQLTAPATMTDRPSRNQACATAGPATSVLTTESPGQRHSVADTHACILPEGNLGWQAGCTGAKSDRADEHHNDGHEDQPVYDRRLADLVRNRPADNLRGEPVG